MRKFLVIFLALFAYTGTWATETAKVKVTNGATITWVDIKGNIYGTKFVPWEYGLKSSPAGILDLSEVWSGEGTGTHYTVTGIGESAFSYETGLTSIVLPNSVTSIGDNAFSGCTGLSSIEIPNSVTSIGEDAFSYCTALTSIELPNSVTSIGDWTFQNCI